MGTKPPKPKRTSKKDSTDAASSSDEDEKNEDDNDDDDDWRKFFDEEPVKADAGKPKPAGARLHKLTIHQSLHSLSSHRAVFTRAWLTLLPRLSIDSEAGKSKTLAARALNVMHRGVMPHLTRPVLVMDWVGASVDFGEFWLVFFKFASLHTALELGGTVGLLALNALFVLMKEYNLYVISFPLPYQTLILCSSDYPSFYTRLYTFLDRDVLHLKHRARFFRMTEMFLSSTYVLATTYF